MKADAEPSPDTCRVQLIGLLTDAAFFAGQLAHQQHDHAKLLRWWQTEFDSMRLALERMK